MFAWKMQSLVWLFLPESRDINFSLLLLALLLGFCALLFAAGRWLRRPGWSRSALVLGFAALCISVVMYLMRPHWLEVAMRPVVPMPALSPLQWQQPAPGLETAETVLSVDGVAVDRMVLVRLDPQQYRLSVHWDPAGSKTAEQWQAALGAAVVVNGSYFAQDFTPLTPLRHAGEHYGPLQYSSDHGALVLNGLQPAIIDLKGRDVDAAIAPFADAMVSYPLLIDADGRNRATESRHWLAARNFVALDRAGRVILGSTETGFFTIYRLGEFLRQAPLDLQLALNLDGGPLVSQVVKAGTFERRFHGTAEISNGHDILRVFWHPLFKTHWTLPIVLAAVPVQR